MANYRLPMDADGVKYHGTVDQNEENPGHFMYGLDENGNKRIIRTDEQGNVLTRVTGSNVELFLEENVLIEPQENYRLGDLKTDRFKGVELVFRTKEIPDLDIRIQNKVDLVQVFFEHIGVNKNRFKKIIETSGNYTTVDITNNGDEAVEFYTIYARGVMWTDGDL